MFANLDMPILAANIKMLLLFFIDSTSPLSDLYNADTAIIQTDASPEMGPDCDSYTPEYIIATIFVIRLCVRYGYASRHDAINMVATFLNEFWAYQDEFRRLTALEFYVEFETLQDIQIKGVSRYFDMFYDDEWSILQDALISTFRAPLDGSDADIDDDPFILFVRNELTPYIEIS